MEQENNQNIYLEAPDSHKGMAIGSLICSLICCCSGGIVSIISIITGIMAIKYANETEKLVAMGGDYMEQAKEASSKAGFYTNLTYFLFALWTIIGILVILLGGFSAISAISNLFS